jgi:Fic family protein
MKSYHRWIWEGERWPEFEYSVPDLKEVYYRFGRLKTVETLLGRSVNEALMAQALEDEAVATSIIEGEYLQRSSVRASVQKALKLEADVTHTTVQTDALVEVLIDAKRSDKPLSLQRLFRWYKALFSTGQSGLREISVGKFRTDIDGPMQIVSGPWEREKIHYIAPPAERIEAQMHHFLLWLNTEQTLDPVIKSAIAHLWFLLIHPFDDGNGRLARAMSDYVLSSSPNVPVKLFSVASEIHRRKKEYYSVLDAVCIRDDMRIDQWMKWYITMLESAIDDAIQKIDAVRYKTLFWERISNITLNERQRKVIAKMLERLPQPFEGGMRTAKYASITKVSKATAARDLKDLEQKGIFESHGAGRGVYYTLKEVW